MQGGRIFFLYPLFCLFFRSGIPVMLSHVQSKGTGGSVATDPVRGETPLREKITPLRIPPVRVPPRLRG